MLSDVYNETSVKAVASAYMLDEGAIKNHQSLSLSTMDHVFVSRYVILDIVANAILADCQ